MISYDALNRAWRTERAHRLARYARAPSLGANGLSLGPMVVIANRSTDRWGAPVLEIDGCENRILSLLAVAYWRSIRPIVIDQLRLASKALSSRNPALASILMAQAGLGRIDEDERTAFRLFAAEKLLDADVNPRELMKGLGLDPWPLDALTKYSPNQPRVPAGQPGGGEWASDDNSDIPFLYGDPSDEKRTRQSAALIGGADSALPDKKSDCIGECWELLMQFQPAGKWDKNGNDFFRCVQNCLERSG